VRAHEPDVFARVRRVLLPKDWLRLRMTGDAATDCSDASGTLWLDVARRAPGAEPALVVWTFTNAFPVKWSTASFSATEGKIAVETLEMAYAFVERQIKSR
jgi:phage tail-like protein